MREAEARGEAGLSGAEGTERRQVRARRDNGLARVCLGMSREGGWLGGIFWWREELSAGSRGTIVNFGRAECFYCCEGEGECEENWRSGEVFKTLEDK